jgi:hypothetical protein
MGLQTCPTEEEGIEGTCMSDDYLQYIEEIDAGDHDVTKWEADFIESMLSKRPKQLSERQKAVIQRMVEHYLGEVIS